MDLRAPACRQSKCLEASGPIARTIGLPDPSRKNAGLLEARAPSIALAFHEGRPHPTPARSPSLCDPAKGAFHTVDPRGEAARSHVTPSHRTTNGQSRNTLARNC